MFNAISTDFLSSCGTNNKIVGQRFEIQQHNETIGSIYFSADYAYKRYRKRHCKIFRRQSRQQTLLIY